MIGPEQPVKAGVLEDAMKAFYSSFLLVQDIDAACAASRHIEQSMKLYKAEDAFVSAYLRYLELEAQSAKSKRDQIEDLVSKAKADPNLKDVPRMHNIVKAALNIANPKHMLSHLKSKFFMLDEFPEVAEQVQHITLELIRGKAS